MDSLTQACLGASIGGAVMPRLGRRALLIGAALGTLPDLDVVIDYGNAVADYTHHRGFSHSLFVLTGVATLLTLITRLLPRSRDVATFGHRWLLFALCLLTHPLLDAFTTYGTQLLWPLNTPPIAWHSLFIIDPFYTLPLLIGVIVVAVWPRRHRLLRWVLGLSCLYIGFSLGAQAFVESRVRTALAERGLESAPLMVQPAPLTTLLWRVTAVGDTDIQEGWVSLFDGNAPIVFQEWPIGTLGRDVALKTDDGQRLAWFSGPFLRYAHQPMPDGGDRLIAIDVRLGIPGTHPFAFPLAQRAPAEGGAQSQWRAIHGERLSQGRPDGAVLTRLMQRLVDPTVVPIPAPPEADALTWAR
ncbi:metal-dependent hydrolase [Salinicola rhizosphaerae]|uniref:Integral membrane protein n=1 Tax=Salinicola rhizosphaerae TaxID=1443141 RepID=A0ABQ3E1N8_9GAMM|nr:metal-dependent hydrolase [Salinicola rhizosphaerae]GHB22106.1 integral membrane protein [Salinicola rhizosphaerae]